MILYKNSFKLCYLSNHIFHRLILLGRYEFKIFRRIISSVIIFMMDMLPAFEMSVEYLRHYKAVLVNFTSFICHRVMNTKIYFNITMIGSLALKWTISMFLLPCKMWETINTYTSEFTCFEFSQYHIFTPCSDFITLTARNTKHDSLRTIRVNALERFIPINYRTCG